MKGRGVTWLAIRIATWQLSQHVATASRARQGQKMQKRKTQHCKSMCDGMLEKFWASGIYRNNSMRNHVLSRWLAKQIGFLPHRNREMAVGAQRFARPQKARATRKKSKKKVNKPGTRHE